MSVELKSFYHFGLTPGISGSLHFFNDHTVIYPSGANVVLLNTEANTQQILSSVPKSRGVTAIAFCESGKFLAAAEKSDGEKPFISCFEIESSFKRKKIIQINAIQSDRFESLSFSSDGKYLAAVGGPPDHLLSIWIWDSKSQVLCKMKLGSSPPGTGVLPTLPFTVTKPFYSVCFSSMDSRRLVVFGRDTFRQYLIQSSNLLPYRHMRNEGQITSWVVCVAWVSEDSMLLGLDCNTVQYYDGGELKQEFRVVMSKDTDFMLGGFDDPDEFAVRSIVAHDKGFVCTCGRGKICLFEKIDEGNEKYKRLRELEIVLKQTKGDFGGFSIQPYVTSVAINPTQKVFMCLTESGLIYAYDLLKDYRKDVKAQLYLVNSKVHLKEVTSVDVCVRKPLIVTCALDKTICIWNYVTCHLELYKEFIECVYSVSLHPDGLYLIAGLEKSLKLMNIFIDEIYPLKAFPVKNCRSCRFANGGHYFAVANWNVIEIYSSITLNIVYSLRGHVDRVNSLFWSKTDCRIVSVTEDGEMFEWDVLASRKVSENVMKNCHYFDTCIEGKSIFVVGTDFAVKEIQDSTVSKKIANNVLITRLAITNSCHSMFLGLWSGGIRCLQYPVTVPEDGVEYQGHTAPVTGLRVTFDDQLLVSISEDSIVIVWKIIDTKLMAKSKLESTFSKEVLANPIDLEFKNKLLNQLEFKVEQLNAENQLQLHNRDVHYNENLGKVAQKLRNELDGLKQKNNELQMKNEELELKYSRHLLELIRKLRGECTMTEQKSQDKLQIEAEKYQLLKEAGTKTQEAFERELEEKGKKLQQLVYQLITTVSSIKTDPPSPPPDPMIEWEGKIAELEEDTDMELLSRKENFKELFAKENQAISDLNLDIISLKKQVSGLTYTTRTQKKIISGKQGEINRLTSVIHNVEQNIHQLKKLLQEKTEALENRIKIEAELKEKNQNLEKAKFVLDVKMQTLQKQMEPMNSEIKYLKLQVFGKEGEFNDFRKNVNMHRGKIYRGKEKLQALQDLEYNEKVKATTAKKRLNRLVTDLKHCSVDLNNTRMLKKNIVSVYKNNLLKIDNEEEELTENSHLCGMNPQREHLESLISNLKNQMKKNQLKYDNDDKIIMKQNILLMREINELRRELKENQGIINLMTEAIELDRANPKLPTKEFLDMMVNITSNSKLVKKVDEMKQTLDSRMKAIRILQHENLQLKAESEWEDVISEPGETLVQVADTGSRMQLKSLKSLSNTSFNRLMRTGSTTSIGSLDKKSSKKYLGKKFR